ncbi:PIG-L deacetylase family protein [Bacteroidota bacterium]
MKNLIYLLCIAILLFVPIFHAAGQNSAEQKNEKQLRLMLIGAHPDDAEGFGGLAALYAKHGHKVQFVSMTNGDKGHQTMGGAQLARTRYEECQCVGRVIGAEYIVMNTPDGELEPSLENRLDLIRIIRRFNPDLIITHAPDGYHPDHRYTTVLVHDATYMVMVPNLATDAPAMKYNPVLLYGGGSDPDVVIGIDEVAEQKVDMYHCHKSQMYEWLPWIGGYLDKVPEGDAERREWIKNSRTRGWENNANRHRDKLIEIYGKEAGQKIRYAESYTASGYGGRYNDDKLYYYFPFMKEYQDK